jgi:hypothetical protein
MTGDAGGFDRLEQLWKEQEVVEMKIDIGSIRNRARRLGRRVVARNAMEWAAAALLVAWCAFRAVRAEGALEILGHVSLALGAVFVAVYLLLKGRAGRLPDPAGDTSGYVAAYRAQLLSQARLLRRVPLWYLAPIAAGVVVLLLHGALEARAAGGGMWAVGAAGAVVVAVFAGVAALNSRAAARLQAEADTLERG